MPDSAVPADVDLALGIDPVSVRGLSSAIGISKSEVSNGLAKSRRNGRGPSVNRHGLGEFVSHGLRFVFPGKRLGLARGIPTCLTAPVFGGIRRGAEDHPPVWADPRGDTLGLAVEPLYKSVPDAIRGDETLYRLLAIVDSIRLGQPRERKLAITELQHIMDY